MKKWLLGLCISYGFMAQAQLFAPAGAEWVYRVTNPWTNGHYQTTYQYTGDTLINGINAQIIATNSRASYYLNKYYFYSTADAIYCYSYAKGDFTLLADFTKNVGDTVFINNIESICASDSSGTYYKIVDKGIELIDGLSYRYISYNYISTIDFPEYFDGKYYEKIGREYGFFVPEISCTADADYIDCLNKYWDGTDTLSKADICPIPTGTTENPTVNFSLYPNPVVEGEITINSPIQADALQLISMQGQTVLSISITNNKATINELPNGVYLAYLYFKNGKIGHSKLSILR